MHGLEARRGYEGVAAGIAAAAADTAGHLHRCSGDCAAEGLTDCVRSKAAAGHMWTQAPKNLVLLTL